MRKPVSIRNLKTHNRLKLLVYEHLSALYGDDLVVWRLRGRKHFPSTGVFRITVILRSRSQVVRQCQIYPITSEEVRQ